MEINAEIEKIAIELGLDKNDTNLVNAFNVTKIIPRSKKKGCYANSALATLGDTVIKLYLTWKEFKQNKKSSEITIERQEKENNSKLAFICFEHGYPNLRYGDKNQESDKLNDDAATLFEAIIGALFLDLGYDKTAKILDEKFKL